MIAQASALARWLGKAKAYTWQGESLCYARSGKGLGWAKV
jgi:hypothetical protein